jgi:hypothetical protein
VATAQKQIQFALCIENTGAEDLEKGKVCQILANP